MLGFEKTVEVPQLQCSNKVYDVPVVQVVVRVEDASDSVHRQSWVMTAVKVFFSGFSAFFARLRVVPELSASCSWGALDDEEFFVIEGSGVALTPGVSLRCQATSRVYANLSLSGSFVCGQTHASTLRQQQQQQQQQQ